MATRRAKGCARDISQRLELARSQLTDNEFEQVLELVAADLKVWNASLDRFTIVDDADRVLDLAHH